MSPAGSTILFTVGMPVYNHAAFVGQAVGSVLAQTLGDFELVIVDDGSTDGSGKIIDELAARDSRIVASHQPNAGVSAARNAILARARGQWQAWLDADDVWYPDALGSFAACIAAHPRAQFIHGIRHRLNEDGSVTRSEGYFQDRPTGVKELFGKMFLSTLSLTYRRELQQAVGLYDTALPCAEDYDLYLRMSLVATFEPLGLATGLRRRHAGCISTRSGRSRMFEAEVLRRFIEEQGGADRVEPAAVRQRLAKVYSSAANAYARSGCFREALQAYGLAHRYRRSFKSVSMQTICRALSPWSRSSGQPLPSL